MLGFPERDARPKMGVPNGGAFPFGKNVAGDKPIWEKYAASLNPKQASRQALRLIGIAAGSSNWFMKEV